MTDASPFKKAIIDSKAGTPYTTAGSGKQLSWSLIMEADEDYGKEKLQRTVRGILTDIVENGFDQELLESVFNSYEMTIRDDVISKDKGLRNIITATDAWLYDESFEEAFSKNAQIGKLRAKRNDKYF